MSIRKTAFVTGEYYHIYNRGVDKRNIFQDVFDLQRFFQSIVEFNSELPIGSIYENRFNKRNKLKELGGKAPKLVSIIAYCLNPNHFHLILTPLVDKGIQKFMQRLGGYTTYFNEKHDRSGSLFQGKFKSRHIGSNGDLINLSVYVNVNNYDNEGRVKNKLSQSSFEEYIDSDFKDGICDTAFLLDQYRSRKEYEKIARNTWKEICRKKEQLKHFDL